MNLQKPFLINMLKRCIVIFALSLPVYGFSQPGIAEFYAAGAQVKGWYYSLSDLILVIGAIAGIIGGLRVYSNWQMGKSHIDAQVMAWFFSCIFLSLISAFLKSLFGL
nr:DUF4134 family protein [Pedobacter aquatilis]